MLTEKETHILKLLNDGPLDTSQIVAGSFPTVTYKQQDAYRQAHASVVRSLHKLEQAGRITCEFLAGNGPYGPMRAWLNVSGSRPHLTALKRRIETFLQGHTERSWGYASWELREDLYELELHPAILQAALFEMSEEKKVVMTCGRLTHVEYYRSVKQEYGKTLQTIFRSSPLNVPRRHHPTIEDEPSHRK